MILSRLQGEAGVVGSVGSGSGRGCDGSRRDDVRSAGDAELPDPSKTVDEPARVENDDDEDDGQDADDGRQHRQRPAFGRLRLNGYVADERH